MRARSACLADRGHFEAVRPPERHGRPAEVVVPLARQRSDRGSASAVLPRTTAGLSLNRKLFTDALAGKARSAASGDPAPCDRDDFCQYRCDVGPAECAELLCQPVPEPLDGHSARFDEQLAVGVAAEIDPEKIEPLRKGDDAGIATAPWFLLPGAQAGGFVVLLRLARLARLAMATKGPRRLFNRLGRVAVVAGGVVLIGSLVAYYAEHPTNPARLAANAAARGRDRAAGPPREGSALLQGIIACGICGRRMTVRYHQRCGRLLPAYVCQRDADDERVEGAAFAAGQAAVVEDGGDLGVGMVRRLSVDGAPVTAAAAAFGYSRPSYYQAAAALAGSGLEGLVPARPGPRGGHKLTGEILTWAQEQLAADPALKPAALTGPIADQFGVRVHPRSVERALGLSRSSHDCLYPRLDLAIDHLEAHK